MFRYLPRNMNGIFAVEKPSGVSSSHVVLQLQSIFDRSDVFAHDLALAKQRVHDDLSRDKKWLAAKIANRVKRTKIKMGHGGTLDPLARGVLIIGVGTGTKKLNYYLGECTKTYETRAMLGQSTTTGDSEGQVLTRTEVDHIDLASLKKAAARFVGKAKQTPPIFSALKVNGKPLYEYAREGIPLPKAIKVRDVEIHLLEVHGLGPDSRFSPLVSEVDENGNSLESMLASNPTLNDSELYFSDEYMANPEIPDEEKNTHVQAKSTDVSPETLPVFHATASVGSGTYIRSLISDLGRAVGSSAFMVELIRTKQSDWELGKNVFTMAEFEGDGRIWGPVLKRVLDVGAGVTLAEEFSTVTEKLQPLLEEEKRKEEEKKVEGKKVEEKKVEEKKVEKEVENNEEKKEEKVAAEETEVPEVNTKDTEANGEADTKRRKLSST